MSKFIMVALLVASLIAGAAPVMAQPVLQGGIGDPMTLAASGVVIPFITVLSGQPVVSTLQVASPVSDNPNAHMFFYNANCAFVPPSVGIPLTTNDIAFQQIAAAQGGPIAAGTNGLVTIAQSDQTGFSLTPLVNPLHVRMYIFSTADGRSRVIEPIILNTAEFPSIVHWWSPLRTGADFFAPLQSAAVQTDLFLVCPKDSIEGAVGSAFGTDPGGNGNIDFTSTGFPQINPRFPALTAGALPNVIRVRVYDTNEVFKRDFTIDCNCVIIYPAIAQSVSTFYADPVEAAFGTYTEITSTPGTGNRRVTFTGYTSTYTVGSAINAFFARFHNGSQPSIDGTLTSTR
jgi:hypothetical protein